MEDQHRSTRSPAVFLAVSFLTAIGAVPLVQAVLDAAARRLPVVTDLRSFEETLESTSFLRDRVLPRVQAMLVDLGAGNEQVYLGRDGWLFYRADVDHVAGPAFLTAANDPVRALVDFHHQLRDRGVDLLVVPVPVKPTIHPEKLWRASAAPVRNPSFEAFAAALAEAGVEILDLAPVLLDHKRPDRPAYLATDTHWTPQAVRAAAAEIADRVRRRHPDLASTDLAGAASMTRVAQLGDTARMLATGRWPREAVRLDPVAESGVATSRPAPILLLGDSFANIYSLEGMGWGHGAGLAEQLGRELGVPIERVTRNDGGALAVRAALARRVARDGELLRRTRLVIYEFAARELSQGDWRLLPLPE